MFLILVMEQIKKEGNNRQETTGKEGITWARGPHTNNKENIMGEQGLFTEVVEGKVWKWNKPTGFAYMAAAPGGAEEIDKLRLSGENIIDEEVSFLLGSVVRTSLIGDVLKCTTDGKIRKALYIVGVIDIATGEVMEGENGNTLCLVSEDYNKVKAKFDQVVKSMKFTESLVPRG